MNETTKAPAVPDNATQAQVYGLFDEYIEDRFKKKPDELRAEIQAVGEITAETRKQERQFLADKAEDSDFIPKSYRRQAAQTIALDSRSATRAGEVSYGASQPFGIPLKGAGLVSARIFRALMAEAKGLTPDARSLVKNDWSDPGTAEYIDLIKTGQQQLRTKALASELAADGGILIPEQFLMDIIPLLRAEAVMFSLGVRTLPLSGLSIRLPRHLSSVTAQWAQENVEFNASQGTLGYMALNLRKLSIITASSNELLAMSPEADRWLRDDMIVTGGLALDDALMRGLGTNSEPRGVRYAAAAANVSARTQAGASSTLAEITRDLFSMIEDVEGSNVRIRSGGWIMRSRTKNIGLMSVRDGNGNLVFADELSRGTLMGFPVRIANQIPQNLGGGDETELYFGSWDNYIYAESSAGSLGTSVREFPGGTYRDASGTLVSGISADQTVFRLNFYADGDARHPEAFSIRTAIDWGA